MSSETTVDLLVVDRSDPVMEKRHMTVKIPESASILSPITTVKARSRVGHPLFFTLLDSDHARLFSIDPQSGNYKIFFLHS